MRATLISTVDQIATSKNSHVGLVELDPKVIKDLRRKILTIVTLYARLLVTRHHILNVLAELTRHQRRT